MCSVAAGGSAGSGSQPRGRPSTHTYVRAHAYVRTHTYARTHTYVRTHTQTRVHSFSIAQTHIHKQHCSLTNTHTHTYAHTHSVAAGGPADSCGVRRGHRLVAVDGITLIGLRTAEIHELIKGPVGTTVNLAVEIDGVCLCVSVCFRDMASERDRERQRETERDRERVCVGERVCVFVESTNLSKGPSKLFIWILNLMVSLCLCLCVRVCMRLCVRIRVCVCMCAYMCVCMCACVCVCMCAKIHELVQGPVGTRTRGQP